MKLLRRLALACLFALAALPAAAGTHNVVIFVADGLRYQSVTPQTAPTMYSIRSRGVDFKNSHSIYPTLTTANASTIATGHYLGDTGDYANTLYVGFPVSAKENAPVVFLEDDAVLKEVKAHFGNGYLGPQSLLAAARAHGMTTAAVGKTGPSAIQDIAALDNRAGILLDDAVGKDNSPVVLNPDIARQIEAASGRSEAPSASMPNVAQQEYLAAATAQVLLPYLKAKGKPFVLLFWSRDPDATQHGTRDSIGALTPGINGDTVRAAIANADSNLKTILDALGKLGLSGNTDVFVTADHGFSTVSRSSPDEHGEIGAQEYPPGFVATDVAKWLGKKLFDPDNENGEIDYANGDHPSRGNALIGDAPDVPEAIVADNGGSDFIYVPEPDSHPRAKQVYDQLVQQPYVGALFVNDALLKNGGAKDFPGALPMSTINLIGSANVPQPSIIIGFRSFDAKGCGISAQMCAAEIADTGAKTGQGMHGSFSRADTRNFMAAIGPDFKTHFVDTAPVSNADIAPTLVQILHLTLASKGSLTGRPAIEALKGGRRVSVTRGWLAATPAPNGIKTVLEYQQVGGTRYFDAGGIAGRTVGLSAH